VVDTASGPNSFHNTCLPASLVHPCRPVTAEGSTSRSLARSLTPHVSFRASHSLFRLVDPSPARRAPSRPSSYRRRPAALRPRALQTLTPRVHPCSSASRATGTIARLSFAPASPQSGASTCPRATRPLLLLLAPAIAPQCTHAARRALALARLPLALSSLPPHCGRHLRASLLQLLSSRVAGARGAATARAGPLRQHASGLSTARSTRPARPPAPRYPRCGFSSLSSPQGSRTKPRRHGSTQHACDSSRTHASLHYEPIARP